MATARGVTNGSTKDSVMTSVDAREHMSKYKVPIWSKSRITNRNWKLKKFSDFIVCNRFDFVFVLKPWPVAIRGKAVIESGCYSGRTVGRLH